MNNKKNNQKFPGNISKNEVPTANIKQSIPTPSISSTAPAAPAVGAKELALIYAKLAVHDHEKEKDSKVKISIYTACSKEDYDVAVVAQAREKFSAAACLTAAEKSDDGMMLKNAKMKMDYINGLLMTEEEAVNASLNALKARFEELQAAKRKRDTMTAEVFRLREDLIEVERKTKPTQELCRNVQKREGIMRENYAEMLRIEKEGNEKFRSECTASASSILDKIKVEEEDLALKEKENIELRSKLEQFKAHLDLRRDKIENLKKTRVLEKQLQEARGAQRKYVLDQQTLKSNSLKAQLLQSQETTHTYKQQIELYAKKFEEFEDTLGRTAEVMKSFEERRRALQTMADSVIAENEDLRKRATQEDIALIKGTDMSTAVEKSIIELKQELDRLTPVCRDLQARRKELLQQKKSVAGSSSGSTSSGAGQSAPTGTSS